MSLNYDLIDTIKLISLKDNMFISVIVSVIILTIILLINKDRRFIKYLVLIINIILISFIFYYYLNDILSFKFKSPINNIYFYFFNSIIFLVLNTIVIFRNKYKKINYIFYLLSLINLGYSLFMTYYLGNHTLIVIGNIFPMVKFGNIIYLIYYLLLLMLSIKDKFLTKKI